MSKEAKSRVKVPAFQFYPSDFLSDENVQIMSNQQVGCYIKLMSFCWREGSIPCEMLKIARLCGEPIEVMKDLWTDIARCFEVLDESGRLTHPRLKKELAKQVAFREKMQKAGRKGALTRWKKTHDAELVDGAGKDTGEQKPGGSKKNGASRANKVTEYTGDFLIAWEAYPPRPGANKKAAFQKWNASLNKGHSPTRIIAGIRAYRRFVEAVGTEPHMIKQMETFLGPMEHFMSDYPLPTKPAGGAPGSQTTLLVEQTHTGVGRL